MIENKDLLLGVCNIAIKAGEEILKYYNDDIEVRQKDDSSPLTKADLAANKIIVNELELLNIKVPILSEESLVEWNERKNWIKYWLVDPLDGTKEFIKKNGEFTVNIALIKNGFPILGIVYAPVLDITWGGSRELGSFMIKNNEKKPINVTVPKTDAVIKVVSSRSHSNNPKLEDFLKKITEYELVKMGSSIKICLVADGSAHFYPRFGPTMEWDTAAAHAVVKFAGGNIINFNTNLELSYNKDNLLNPEFLVNYK